MRGGASARGGQSPSPHPCPARLGGKCQIRADRLRRLHSAHGSASSRNGTLAISGHIGSAQSTPQPQKPVRNPSFRSRGKDLVNFFKRMVAGLAPAGDVYRLRANKS